MYDTFTRMTSLVLAFGLLIGCSTLSPSSKKFSLEAEHSQKELEAQLEKINDSLSEDPRNGNNYYRKGYVLSELALTIDEPGARNSLYEKMHQSLKKAEELFARSGHLTGKQKVDELLKVKWSNEHNQGVQIIQTDSTLGNKEYSLAAAYFNNATIILPDSVISYKLEARAYYQNRQPEQAVATLEEARRHIDSLPLEVLEQLAFLYLETGQPDKAVSVYEQAESFSEENLNLLHGLANAYIRANKHAEALELLDVLIQNEPENIVYAQAKGMELYFLGAAKIDVITSSPDPENALQSETLLTIDSLFHQAETELTKSLQTNPDSSELEQGLAYFYTNSAAKYQKLVRYTSGKVSDKVKQQIETYLRSSIPLFVALTAEKPEENMFWENLYQAYSYLGMNEKAEEIQIKINR